MRPITRTLVTLAGALVLAALALWFAAIWVIGPDSARLAGTGVIAFFLAIVAFIVGALLDHDPREQVRRDS